MSEKLGGQAARGAGVAIGGQWLRFIVQTLGIVTLGRLLTPGDYGLVAVVIAITGFAGILGDFGFSLAAIQNQEITHRQKSNLFWLNSTLGVVASVAMWAAAPLVADFYVDPRIGLISRLLACALLLQALTAQFRAELTRRLAFGRLAISDILAQALALIVAVSLAFTGFGYWALVAQQVALAAVPLLYLVSVARWWPGLPRRAPMRSLIAFGARHTMVQVLNYVSDSIDSVALGRTDGTVAVGYYNRAYQLMLMPLVQIAAPIGRVALPVLARIKDPSRYQHYVESAQRALVYGLGGVFFVAACLAKPLVEVLLGSQWSESVPLFRILSVAGLFQSLGVLYPWIYLSKALTKLQLRLAWICRPLMVVCVLVGVNWGSVGTAIGMSVAAGLNWLVHTAIGIPRTGVRVGGLLAVSTRPVLVYAAAALLVAPWLAFVEATYGIAQQVLIGLASILSAAAVAMGVIPSVRRDLRQLANMASLIKKDPGDQQ